MSLDFKAVLPNEADETGRNESCTTCEWMEAKKLCDAPFIVAKNIAPVRLARTRSKEIRQHIPHGRCSRAADLHCLCVAFFKHPILEATARSS